MSPDALLLLPPEARTALALREARAALAAPRSTFRAMLHVRLDAQRVAGWRVNARAQSSHLAAAYADAMMRGDFGLAPDPIYIEAGAVCGGNHRVSAIAVHGAILERAVVVYDHVGVSTGLARMTIQQVVWGVISMLRPTLEQASTDVDLTPIVVEQLEQYEHADVVAAVERVTHETLAIARRFRYPRHSGALGQAPGARRALPRALKAKLFARRPELDAQMERLQAASPGEPTEASFLAIFDRFRAANSRTASLPAAAARKRWREMLLNALVNAFDPDTYTMSRRLFDLVDRLDYGDLVFLQSIVGGRQDVSCAEHVHACTRLREVGAVHRSDSAPLVTELGVRLAAFIGRR